MIAVGHVEAHDIHTGMSQFLQHRIGIRRWTYRADDLGLAHESGDRERGANDTEIPRD